MRDIAMAVVRYAERNGPKRPWLVQLLARRKIIGDKERFLVHSPSRIRYFGGIGRWPLACLCAIRGLSGCVALSTIERGLTMSNENVPILYVVEVFDDDGKTLLGYAVAERIAFVPAGQAGEAPQGLVQVREIGDFLHNCFFEKPPELREFRSIEMPAERDKTGGVTILASGHKPRGSDR